MQLIRPPCLPPPNIATPHCLPKPGADGRQPVVRIYHPGYPDPDNELITIPAVDPLPSIQGRQGAQATQDGRVRTEQEQEHGQEEHATVRRDRDELGATDAEVDVGLHHGTVLTICGIIAENAFDRVFLSYDRSGLSRVGNWQFDGILPAGDYWLQVTPLPESSGSDGAGHVAASRPEASASRGPESVATGSMPPPPPPQRVPPPAAQTPYAIVPNFESWRFPHNRMPSSWRQAHEPPPAISAPGLPNLIAQRLDTLQPPHMAPSCVISGHSGAVEQAHIVPKACMDWFTHNGMRVYNTPSPQQLGRIDQPPNKIALRSDIHDLFDSRCLAIVPKPVFVQPPLPPSSPAEVTTAVPRGPSQYALAVHVLSAPTYELIPLYHNLALRFKGPGNGPSQQYLGSREFLFASFAWSIFRLVQGFLDTERWVAVSSKQSLGHPSAAAYEYKWASNANFAPKTRGSSRSSSKRPASELDQDGDAATDTVYLNKRRRLSPQLKAKRLHRPSDELLSDSDDVSPNTRLQPDSQSPLSETTHRRARRRLRSVEALLNSGEELGDDELFQLDESQLLLYETMRRRIERRGLVHDSSRNTHDKIARWRAETTSAEGETVIEDRHRDSSPPDLSCLSSDGSDNSDLLPFPDDIDPNGDAVTAEQSTGKASRTSLADMSPDGTISGRA